jgi:hypothetical protein
VPLWLLLRLKIVLVPSADMAGSFMMKSPMSGKDYSNQYKGRTHYHIEIITFIHQRLCPMEYNEKDVIWRHVKIAGQS